MARRKTTRTAADDAPADPLVAAVEEAAEESVAQEPVENVDDHVAVLAEPDVELPADVEPETTTDETEVDAVFDEPEAEPEAPADDARMTVDEAIAVAIDALAMRCALKPSDSLDGTMVEDCPEAVAHNVLLEHANGFDD